MAKLAVLFVAALAFTAAFAGEDATRALKKHFRVQAVTTQVQESGNDAVEAIQNVQTDNQQGQRNLVIQANEYTNQIQHAVYQLNKAIQSNQDAQGNQGPNQQQLKEASEQLSDIVHAVQKTINSEPAQLKTQLKTAVQSVVAQVQKLSQAVQQTRQLAKTQQRQASVSNQVREVVDTILAATQRIQVQAQHQQRSQDEIKNKIQEVTNKVSTAIKNVKTQDQQTIEELVDQVQDFAQVVEDVVSELESWAHDNQDQTNNVKVVQQVSQKLSEIEDNLEKVASNQGQGSPQVSELKNQLDTNFHNAAVQIQKLVEVQQAGGQEGQVGQTAKQLVSHVLVQSLAAAKTLYTQLQLTAQGPQEN